MRILTFAALPGTFSREFQVSVLPAPGVTPDVVPVTKAQAEDILAEGRADAVFLARELTRDPHFALRAAAELGADIEYVPLSFRASVWS